MKSGMKLVRKKSAKARKSVASSRPRAIPKRFLAEQKKAKAAMDETAALVLALKSVHESRQEEASSAKRKYEEARGQEREVALKFGRLQYKDYILKRHQEICE